MMGGSRRRHYKLLTIIIIIIGTTTVLLIIRTTSSFVTHTHAVFLYTSTVHIFCLLETIKNDEGWLERDLGVHCKLVLALSVIAKMVLLLG
jgi:hypothetical protein